MRAMGAANVSKVMAHSGAPINEAADALAAAAAESDPARLAEMDLDPEAIHRLYKEKLGREP